MKKIYIFLIILGTILPNIFVVKESLATGNILLYMRPFDTISGMFINNISSAFVVDLLFILMLFLIWSHKETRKHNIKNVWLIWLYTFTLGLAGGLPLFLYIRELRLDSMESKRALTTPITN